MLISKRAAPKVEPASCWEGGKGEKMIPKHPGPGREGRREGGGGCREGGGCGARGERREEG